MRNVEDYDVCVYVIKDPVTNQVRYVGRTTNHERRFKEHRGQGSTEKGGGNNWYLYNWMRRMICFGYEPIFEIIDYKNSEWDWIIYYQKQGWIFNSCYSPNNIGKLKEDYPLLNEIRRDIRLIRRRSKAYRKKQQPAPNN